MLELLGNNRQGAASGANNGDKKSKDNIADVSMFFNIVSTICSSFIFLFGATLTCGLILDLSGYGYSLYPPRIEPLDQLRMEQQLKQPSPRLLSMNDEDNNISGQRRKGDATLNEFFLRNPFTTTVILTGAVLTYEFLLGIVKDKNNNDDNNKSK